MISYYKSVSQPAEDFDAVKFGTITRHPSIKKICNKILAANGNHDEVSRLKRKLPAVTWQAWQPEGEMRSAQKCEANGLFMIDVDHIDDPRALYERIKAEQQNWEKDVIMLAHVTPSGKGLRIVAKRYNAVMTIPECQEVFCSHYGIECDKAVKDVCRLSFLVPWDYILFFDEGIFEDADPQKAYPRPLPKGGEAGPPLGELGVFAGEMAAKESPAGETDPRSGSAPLPLGGDGGGLSGDGLLFRGIPFKDIISEVVERTGGAPVTGERNTRLYEIARILRYTVDFDAQKLAQILPSFGLPQSEVAQVAQSAVKSNRAERMPDTLYNIIREFEDFNENENGNENDNENHNGKLKGLLLPPVFKDFADTAPNDFKVPVIVSLLPVLGTLASTARAKYLDGTYHSPSFISVVVAPQASGKSFARRLVNSCLAPLEAEDMKARLDEQAYRKALREAKNSKSQPKEPETMVRCVPASISTAKLLKRLDSARGLHLFTFCEEIDTVAKSNNSGAWAQKSDIYRNAFDNAVYGQDYMTDISYSATLEVFYNLLLLGTPNAVGRFFKDPEDGLVSRVCFTEIPDQFGADMPVWKEMTREQQQHLRAICQKLLDKHSNQQEKHYYDLGEVNTALSKWLEEQRDMAILAVDRARDTARRRAAVVGFRAALVAQAVNECGVVSTEEQMPADDLCRFATYIADIYLSEMLAMYGGAMEKALAGARKAPSTYYKSAFGALGDTFTTADLYALLRRERHKTPPRQVIYYWKKAGLIEKKEDGSYVKCKNVKM